ncbi:PH domain-containing protein [Patescibacteria group bacterium]|nr:MAG: PH domain-containing protein [Patescibacteria group bacterium]
MMRLDQLPNQQEGEKAALFLHRHWLTLVSIAAVFGLLTLLPLAIAVEFADALATFLSDPILGPLLTVVMSIYYLGVWLVTFFEYADYELDIWIVTNERIIDVEQKGLFNRVASELHLANIQDVTTEVKGMLATFLDYGDVYVQTAGQKDRFIFKHVPHPNKVKETIIELSDADKRRHGVGNAAHAV